MARRRASMREGPLAELFRATEAAQKQAEKVEPEPEIRPAAERTAPCSPLPAPFLGRSCGVRCFPTSLSSSS